MIGGPRRDGAGPAAAAAIGRRGGASRRPVVVAAGRVACRCLPPPPSPPSSPSPRVCVCVSARRPASVSVAPPRPHPPPPSVCALLSARHLPLPVERASSRFFFAAATMSSEQVSTRRPRRRIDRRLGADAADRLSGKGFSSALTCRWLGAASRLASPTDTSTWMLSSSLNCRRQFSLPAALAESCVDRVSGRRYLLMLSMWWGFFRRFGSLIFGRSRRLARPSIGRRGGAARGPHRHHGNSGADPVFLSLNQCRRRRAPLPTIERH